MKALISGQTIGGMFPSTPGEPFTSPDMHTFFIMKIDTAGAKLLTAIRGIGAFITLDAQGNVYVAGALYGGNTSIPVTRARSRAIMACKRVAERRS